MLQILLYLRKYAHILLCVISVISLVFIINLLPTAEDYLNAKKSRLKLIEKNLHFGDSQQAFKMLEEFMRNDLTPELKIAAQLAYVEAVIVNSRKFGFPGMIVVEEADLYLRNALRKGVEKGLIKNKRESLAELLVDNNNIEEAIKRYRSLLEGPDDPNTLKIVYLTHLKSLYLDEPSRKEASERALLELEGFIAASEYYKERGLELKLKILVEQGRYDDAISEFKTISQRYPTNGRLQLEYNKAFYKLAKRNEYLAKIDDDLGKRDEALYKRTEAFRQKEYALNGFMLIDKEMAKTKSEKDEAVFMIGEIYRSLDNINASSLLESLESTTLDVEARITRGRFLLSFNHTKKGIDLVKKGLNALKNDYTLKQICVEISEIYEELVKKAKDEEDPGILADFVGVQNEFERFYAGTTLLPNYWDNIAEINLRLASSLKVLAGDLKQRGNEKESAIKLKDANLACLRASEAYTKYFLSRDTKGAEKLKRLERSARALDQGGFHVQAAAVYKELMQVEIDEAKREYYRLNQAMSLKMAGQYENALSVLRDFQKNNEDTHPLTDDVLLEKGNIYMEVGRYSEAASEFSSVRERGRVIITPIARSARTDRLPWADSLYYGSMASFMVYQTFKTSGKMDEAIASLRLARDQIEEYTNRYVNVTGPIDPTIYPVDSLLLFARIELEQRRAHETKLLLEKAVSMPISIKTDKQDSVVFVHFMLADVEYLLGNYARASEIYQVSYKNFGSNPLKLWGLIGNTKTLHKLGELVKARVELSKAEEFMTRTTELQERYPELQGYWKNEITLLTKLLGGEKP